MTHKKAKQSDYARYAPVRFLRRDEVCRDHTRRVDWVYMRQAGRGLVTGGGVQREGYRMSRGLIAA